MNSEQATKRAEVVDEVSKWSVGLGIVVVALFPLSIPILVLTAVALVPLAIPLIAVAILALPVLLGRRLVARLIARNGRRRSAAPTGPSTIVTPFATTGNGSSARSRAASTPSHSARSRTAH